MKLHTFIAYILFLTLVWMNFYAQVREAYNGVPEYQAQLSKLKKDIESERMVYALEREQFLEFRQTVAALMPGVLKQKGEGQEGYPYRSLASTISKKESEALRQTIAKTLFEKGKESFRKGDYPKAIRAFKELTSRYSYTPFVVEGYFLLIESHFQESEWEDCISIVQNMVELFPQHELTGMALIRLGRIYQMQNRNEEAIDIFKTVIRSYPQRDVASQAKASLKDLSL